MKRNLFLLILAATMLVVSCTPEVKIIENPMIQASNTETIDITRVEITDSATYVNVEAYFHPHYWIRFVKETYLQVDGKKYVITAAEGCELDKEFWMPDSGRASFRFTFPPIPKRAKSMDFIEGDCPDCFKLYGIDLTGELTFEDMQKPHPDIPKELLSINEQATMPKPIYDVDTTTITIHLLNYQKGIADELMLINNAIYGDQEQLFAKVDTESGTAKFEFMQYGTSKGWVSPTSTNRLLAELLIAPGDNIEIYYDLNNTGKKLVARREGKKHTAKAYIKSNLFHDYIAMYTTASDRVQLFGEQLSEITLNTHDGKFADYRWNADEYAKNVKAKYLAAIDKLNAIEGMLPFDKRWFKNGIDLEYFEAVLHSQFFLQHNYRSVHDNFDYSKDIDYKFAILTDEHKKDMFSVVEWDDIYELSLLSFVSMRELAHYLNAPQDNFVRHARDFGRYYLLASNNQLTEKEWNEIDALNNEFITKACKVRVAEIQAKLAEVQGKAKVESVPDVADDKLFDAIIAPHKGKVVVVDFWNTWCGPCREAHKAIARLKEGVLKDKDIVWIYIANESSPEVTYKTTIADIKGLHYRLNGEQWIAITTDKFNIDGIPSYVVVDKDGKYALRNDLRDTNKMGKTLEEMINK